MNKKILLICILSLISLAIVILIIFSISKASLISGNNSVNLTSNTHLKIVALGDSLTEGQGDDEGLGYTARLLTLIQEQRPGSTLLNLGKSGWTSSDLINGTGGQPSQLTTALAQNPDIALVWIGSNDLWYLYEYDINSSLSSEIQQTEASNLTHFQNNINTILSQFMEKGITVFIALLDDQSQRPVASNDVIRSATFPSITKDEVALMSRQVIKYNQAITKSAETYGAILVDLSETDIFKNAVSLYSDSNHPNSFGYQLLANVWYSVIKNYID